MYCNGSCGTGPKGGIHTSLAQRPLPPTSPALSCGESNRRRLRSTAKVSGMPRVRRAPAPTGGRGQLAGPSIGLHRVPCIAGHSGRRPLLDQGAQTVESHQLSRQARHGSGGIFFCEMHSVSGHRIGSGEMPPMPGGERSAHSFSFRRRASTASTVSLQPIARRGRRRQWQREDAEGCS